MNELEQVLIGDSAHTPPDILLEDLASEAAHRAVAGAPRTIYEELWHIAFWRQVTLDWVRGIETAYPMHASAGFPAAGDVEKEDWDRLCQRFFATNQPTRKRPRPRSIRPGSASKCAARRGRACRCGP
jgi:hypothetical protein